MNGFPSFFPCFYMFRDFFLFFFFPVEHILILSSDDKKHWIQNKFRVKEAPGGLEFLALGWRQVGLRPQGAVPMAAPRVGGRSGWHRRDHGHCTLTGGPTARRKGAHARISGESASVVPGLDLVKWEGSQVHRLLPGCLCVVGPVQPITASIPSSGVWVSRTWEACRPPPCMAGAVGVQKGPGAESLPQRVLSLPRQASLHGVSESWGLGWWRGCPGAPCSWQEAAAAAACWAKLVAALTPSRGQVRTVPRTRWPPHYPYLTAE